MTPVSIEEAFPEGELAVSPSLRRITNHFLNFFFFFFFFFNSRHPPFHGHQAARQFAQCPAACRRGGPWAASSAAATLRSASSLGKGPSSGTGQGMWAPTLQAFPPKLTDQFFHPLRGLPENERLFTSIPSCVQLKQKSPPGAHISATARLPQGFVRI